MLTGIRVGVVQDTSIVAFGLAISSATDVTFATVEFTLLVFGELVLRVAVIEMGGEFLMDATAGAVPVEGMEVFVVQMLAAKTR